MAYINVSIPTASDIRAEQQHHATEKERDFWLKKSEELQRKLEGIVEAAEEHGYVDFYHRGEKVTLYTMAKSIEVGPPRMTEAELMDALEPLTATR